MRDDTGFEELVASHAGAVRAYAARRVPVGAVDDIVAEVFLAAWRKRDALPHPNARPWLFRAAALVIAEHHRTTGRRDRRDRLTALPDVTADAAGRVPDQVVVQQALAELSAADAEILRLAYWDDLPSRDIALVLGCTPGAVRVRLHRARGRLAEVLTHQPATPTHEGAQR